MSRGGRGGFGGGRGGMAPKIGIEYDPDLDNSVDNKPSETFPPIQPPIAEPPTAEEKRIVHHFRTLRARIHDGPLYTVLGDNVRVTKSSHRTPPTAHFDPFEGQPTYTQRYKKKRNTLPRLSTRPFVKDFFPKELWSTIDPSDKSHLKKHLSISTRTRLDNFMTLTDLYGDDDERGPNDENADGDAEKDDDADDADAENEDPAAAAEEDADPDQFDEDDEDDNDDYNAEQYFEGGDDDDGADDAGGAGEDDY